MLTEINKSYWYDAIHILSWMAMALQPSRIDEQPTAPALKGRSENTGSMGMGFSSKKLFGTKERNPLFIHKYDSNYEAGFSCLCYPACGFYNYNSEDRFHSNPFDGLKLSPLGF